MILSAHHNKNNSEVLREIFYLYVPQTAIIVDVTYGMGSFWKHITDYNFWGCDIDPTKARDCVLDLRELPFKNESIDCLIIDPPYGSLSTTPRKGNMAKRYGLFFTGEEFVRGLYIAGIKEAYRVLKNNGIVIVKTMDAVNSGKQQWFHIEIFDLANKTGFLPEDLFIVSRDYVMVRHKNIPQKHARKNHSYFWIFKKI